MSRVVVIGAGAMGLAAAYHALKRGHQVTVLEAAPEAGGMAAHFDLGGLSIAYKAWKISLAGKPSPEIDGLSGEKRFFMGWAQAWRAKAREEYLRRQVLADPHAWAEFRANGPLGNIDAFYEAFGVKPGDKLYREPSKRVKIW